MLSGESAVDRSMMTGEPVPVEAAAGDAVIGGTIALTGRLVVRAVQVGEFTQLAQLVALVGRAQAEKAAIQRLADRVSRRFRPAGARGRGADAGRRLLAGAAAGQAFSAGLAVLIIACPCALGLATPAALVAACGRGAQLGIFIKGHQALESSGLIDTVVFDKTGTVTSGRMTVTALAAAPGTEPAEVLRYAAAVEHASEHPVAAAISAASEDAAAASAAADGRGGPVPPARAVRCRRLPGAAGPRRARRGGGPPGRRRPRAAAARPRGRDPARTGGPVGAVGADRPDRGPGRLGRSAARRARRRRHGQARRPRPPWPGCAAFGLRPVLLTGDNEATARAVAAAVGIEEVIAGILPAGKAAAIRDLQERGHRVAMVGDGVNDAPALAAADLGMAVGAGTDVAISAADLILLREDLQVVPEAIMLARAARSTIRRNLAWAFGYNVAAVPLAALGFLNPLIAAAAMTLSSVLVVANSLRLRRFRPG